MPIANPGFEASVSSAWPIFMQKSILCVCVCLYYLIGGQLFDTARIYGALVIFHWDTCLPDQTVERLQDVYKMNPIIISRRRNVRLGSFTGISDVNRGNLWSTFHNISGAHCKVFTMHPHHTGFTCVRSLLEICSCCIFGDLIFFGDFTTKSENAHI